MKLENQLSNLELSKRLEKLGVKQESLFWWCEFSHRENAPIDGTKLFDKEIAQARMRNVPHLKTYSVFTVAELGEMLPDGFRIWKDGSPWVCSVIGIDYAGHADTEANARAKMVIYLKENKLQF